MGPFLLIDKSAIQSFSPAEIDVLHRHYSVITCPILIQEIKANLVKHPNDPVLSQNKVAALAGKAGRFGGLTIDHHNVLCYASLLGARFHLRPQIPRFDGQEKIDTYGHHGIVFEKTPERQTLDRLANKIFSKADLDIAKEHVRNLKGINLETIHKENADLFPETAQVKSLADLESFLDSAQRETNSGTWSIIEADMKALGFPEEVKKRVNERWENSGRPTMLEFSEYGLFFHRVNVLFWVGLTAGLIPTSIHDKAIIDYQYLFYAPFAHAFCSGDNFQRDFSKGILRADQEFVWAADLKKDLNQLASCHAKMSESDRKWYVRNFGDRPPPIQGSLTVKLWEEFMRPWALNSGNRALDLPPEDHKKIGSSPNRVGEKAVFRLS
jgi:hypothetical protein